MGVQNPNSTSYEHPDEPNLLNLHKALTYNSDGEPTVRVALGGEDVTITGNVTIPGSVEISNDIGNPVPVTGNVNAVVTGTVDIGTMPEVEIKNDTGNPIPISRNTNANSSGNPIYVAGEISTSPSGAVATTAFGEPLAITITPVIQLDAVYGFDPDKVEEFTASSGSATPQNSALVLSSGTAQYGYSVIQTVRAVRYRPGQGALARFTAAFVDPADGYTQRAGFGTLENAIQVGYNGTQFGVLRATGGVAELWHLTITNPAGPTSETVTVTLNSVAYTVTVSGTDPNNNAAVLGEAIYTGWRSEDHSNEVHFQAQSLGPKNGIYSVTSTGSLTGTFTRLQQGITQTENWTYQADFNIDTLDGNGPSGMVLDPSKLNVYQINFRWSGVGEIRYAIEDANNGNMIFFHHEHYTNRYTIPHLLNPSMKIQYVAASLGGTGANVKVCGSSIMGAIEGLIQVTNLPNSVGNSRSGIAQNTYEHLLSIRNHNIFQNKVNQREIILKRISAAATSASSSPIQVFLYKTITCTDAREWVNIGAGSFASYSLQDTTVNHQQDRVIYQFVIMPGAANSIDLSDLRIIISPGQSCAVGIYATNTVQNAGVTLTWIED